MCGAVLQDCGDAPTKIACRTQVPVTGGRASKVIFNLTA